MSIWFVPTALSLVLAAGRGGDAPPAVPETPRWAALVAFDKVRVEVDAARLGGARGGERHARLRWSLRSAEVSPAAWRMGVRTTVDEVDVDCPSQSSRTLASAAFDAGGALVPAASFAVSSAAWRRDAPESVGGLVTAAVCRALGRAFERGGG